jgi:PTH2 family peptidyl-tRNA hydrolase
MDDLKIKIDMMNEADLKGELSDEELLELDKYKFEYDLYTHMKSDGFIRSIKRKDIAYYSEKEDKFLLRYNFSTDFHHPTYDSKPVEFDFKYINTFEKVYDKAIFSEKLKIPYNRNNTEPKQVIVVNRSLNMPHGKLAAQVAHASLGALFKCGVKRQDMIHIDLRTGDAVEQWLNGRFTKIVLYVKSDEKLQKIYQKALDADLPTVMIEDAGFTVFDGKQTRTCVGIGPVFPDELIGITDKLRIL